MGALPSTISCDSTPPPASIYSVGSSGRTFTTACQQDTTGPVLSISNAGLYDCIQSCAAVKACAAVSWTAGTCYQKSSTGSLVPSNSVSTFYDYSASSNAPICPSSDGQTYTSTKQSFVIGCGIDYPGIGDMGPSSQPDLRTCIDTCDSTTGCVAVAYSGNTCYLKNTIGPASSNSGVQSAVVAGTVSQSSAPIGHPSCPSDDGTVVTRGGLAYTIKCGADYYGGDLTSTQTTSFGACIDACSASKQCVDVSYVQGACYLKSQLTTLAANEQVWTAVQTTASRAPPADTNSLSVRCPGDNPVSYTSTAGTSSKAFSISCGTDYYGGDFLFLETDTLQKCVDTCASHSECVSLSYRGVGCYLKSTLTTPVTDPNSGVIGAQLANGLSRPPLQVA